VTDIAAALIDDRDIDVKVIGTRPGEKLHEVLITEEEASRTYQSDPYYKIAPILPELQSAEGLSEKALEQEYTSADEVMDFAGTRDLLIRNNLMLPRDLEDYKLTANGELLR